MRLKYISSTHLYFKITFQLVRLGARWGFAEKYKGTSVGPGERNTITGVSQSSFQALRVEVKRRRTCLVFSCHSAAHSGVWKDEAIEGQDH